MLTLVRHDGFTEARVTNPWDTTSCLATYLLVPRNFPSDSLKSLPSGTVVRVPLESSLVYSGVHGGAVNELGALDAVTAVADGKYFTTTAIKSRIASGRIRDVGNSMSPSVEMIVDVAPEAILTSPYENSGNGAIDALGISIIEMADYMEPTPLGRAEWIKFLGALYGKEEMADSIFRDVCRSYAALVSKASRASGRPVVLVEQPASGVWAVAGGRSYMARMFADAGAVYPWAADNASGSIELDPAAVLEKAGNADIWLIRSFGPLTLEMMKADNPIVANFRPWRDGGVYVSDTSRSPLFDEFPFHPEKLMADYVAIFHPELSADSTELRYFSRME